MASELVNSATSEKLPEVDWAKYIEICELVAHDQRYCREFVINTPYLLLVHFIFKDCSGNSTNEICG